VGGAGTGGLHLSEVHRFHYPPRVVDGHLRWDAAALTRGILAGSRVHGIRREPGRASRLGGRRLVGVDYALVDAAAPARGSDLLPATAARSARWTRCLPSCRARGVRPHWIQFHRFNTLFQLWAHAPLRPASPRRAPAADSRTTATRSCAVDRGERTDASTTQLLGRRAGRGTTSSSLARPASRLSPSSSRRHTLGTLRCAIARGLGIGTIEVVAPGTHDTASAVAGTPLARHGAYISSAPGRCWASRWMRRSSPRPPAAQTSPTRRPCSVAVRLLTNVMGLWLLESCRRAWEAEGRPQDLSALLAAGGRSDGSRRA